MQKAHKPTRTVKLPALIHRRILAIVEIYVNSGLPITTVPCFHQSKVHIKRKLRGRTAQTYNPLVGAQSLQAYAGRKTTRSYPSPYIGDSRNLREFGAPNRHGTLFAPKQGEYKGS